MSAGRGWPWFAAWIAAGTLLAFSGLGGFSIGLFVLLFAVVVALLVGRRAAAWPDGLGLAAGAGVVLLLVAALNHDYEPCPDGPLRLRPGETSYSCGGLDPTPWLLGGLALVGAAVAVYALARSKARPPRGGLSGGELALLAFALAFALMGVTAPVSLGGSGVEIRQEPPTPAAPP